MSKSKLFILQFSFILQVAFIFGLLVMRYFPKTLLGVENNTVETSVLSPLANDFGVTEALSPSDVRLVPEKILFPSLDHTLPIATASILAGEWTLFSDQASWLSTSAPLTVGNTIIYAHNRVGLFGDLKKLAIGDEIVVGSGEKEFRYQVNELRKVQPDEVSAILSDENQLTLYTCDGRFDEKRLVVIAKPVQDSI